MNYIGYRVELEFIRIRPQGVYLSFFILKNFLYCFYFEIQVDYMRCVLDRSV